MRTAQLGSASISTLSRYEAHTRRKAPERAQTGLYNMVCYCEDRASPCKWSQRFFNILVASASLELEHHIAIIGGRSDLQKSEIRQPVGSSRLVWGGLGNAGEKIKIAMLQL